MASESSIVVFNVLDFFRSRIATYSGSDPNLEIATVAQQIESHVPRLHSPGQLELWGLYDLVRLVVSVESDTQAMRAWKWATTTSVHHWTADVSGEAACEGQILTTEAVLYRYQVQWLEVEARLFDPRSVTISEATSNEIVHLNLDTVETDDLIEESGEIDIIIESFFKIPTKTPLVLVGFKTDPVYVDPADQLIPQTTFHCVFYHEWSYAEEANQLSESSLNEMYTHLYLQS